jgi:hypothetical protein
MSFLHFGPQRAHNRHALIEALGAEFWVPVE